MKKTYIQPVIQIVPIRHSSIICSSGSEVRSVSSNADVEYGGGSAGSARVRQHDVWNDWGE